MTEIPKGAKKVFEGILFDVYHWEQELFDGTKTTFERITHKPSVQIIPVVDGKIILLEEEHPAREPFTSLVGGGVEKGESTEEAARRELLEETHLESNDLQFWRKTDFTGHIFWESDYFIAKDCKKIDDVINPDSGEKITVLYLDFEDFVDIVLDGKFRNKAFTYLVYEMIYRNKLDKFKEMLLS